VPDARQAQHVFHGEQQRECPFEDIEQRVKALHRLHAIEDHHCHAGEDQQDQQEIEQQTGAGVGLEDDRIDAQAPRVLWASQGRRSFRLRD
jgi:hypothetical protein